MLFDVLHQKFYSSSSLSTSLDNAQRTRVIERQCCYDNTRLFARSDSVSLLAISKIKNRIKGNTFRVGRSCTNEIDRRIERVARKGFPTMEFQPMETTHWPQNGTLQNWWCVVGALRKNDVLGEKCVCVSIMVSFIKRFFSKTALALWYLVTNNYWTTSRPSVTTLRYNDSVLLKKKKTRIQKYQHPMEK